MEANPWEGLRKRVKNCGFLKCPRNRDKVPILFNREGPLTKIKFLAVSQEPAPSLAKHAGSDTRKMEELLIKQCSEGKGVLPRKLARIFGCFNPQQDEIYWTHALKCVSLCGHDINKEWEECAEFCKEHFREELNLIKPKAVIAIGRYPLTLCKHLLQGEELGRVEKIVKYILEARPDGRLPGREMRLFAFIHPSNENRVKAGKTEEEREKIKEEIRKKEDRFIQEIKRLRWADCSSPHS